VLVRELCLTFNQSPHDASLLLRGLKTLAVRVERQSDTAHHLALFLSTHPAVRRVHYPGLPSHPQHAVAKRQMTKFGSMLAFVVVGGQNSAVTVANVSRVAYIQPPFTPPLALPRPV